MTKILIFIVLMSIGSCTQQYYLVSLDNKEAHVAKKVKKNGRCVTFQDHKGKWYILCGKYEIKKLHKGR